MADRIVRTTCGICQIGCGVLVHLDSGRITRLEGDPDNPLNKGHLCPKGLASLEYLYSRDRLRTPLLREGARGEGRWRAASWDETLDVIAGRLGEIKGESGPESVVFMRGAAKGLQDEYLARFANCFGSPNFTSMGYVCFIPRRNASVLTYGFQAIPDFDHTPGLVVVWGENMSETESHIYRRMRGAVRRGTKLCVIDPHRTRAAGEADLWVRLKPGTDLALALGMIHVIIEEGLHDEVFVAEQTVGFEELRAHVVAYTPERVADLTWVDADVVRQLARTYAGSKPAVIQWGNGIDHTPQNFQTARAICILRAITGNLGVPGGELRWTSPPLVERGSTAMSLHDRIPPEVREKRLTGGMKMLPSVFYALQYAAMDAILKKDPYPVRAAYIQGCNALLSIPNARKMHEALSSLDFLVVSDLFMTPTAALADVVLPSVSYLEFDSIQAPPYSLAVVTVQQKVAQMGSARSDYETLRDLAGRLGFGGDFWDTEEECLDFLLKPSGITFEEFRQIAVLEGTRLYRDHERNGFPTPSGKVELYSGRLGNWGFDPLPVFTAEEETGPDMQKSYPLYFTTWKQASFRHSGGRQISSLRAMHQEPVVTLHPQTAEAFGIAAGDMVSVETRRGRIVQKAHIDHDMEPRVIGVDYGWWFPEREKEGLFGWDEANVNVLIDDSGPAGKEMGTPALRAIRCRISKAPE